MRLLKGVRVLELGAYITGPFATLLLAELGADVVKVEMPGSGDPFRAFDKQGKYSPQFQAHNRDKRSLTLNYATPEGLGVLKRLVETADVMLINSRPGVPEKLGIGWEVIHGVNPKLVYCMITGFGRDGPYAQRPAFDNVGQAISGWASRHRRGDDPRVIGPAIADPATSQYAALGIVAALFERSQSGKGRLVEVNMLESMIGLATEPLGNFFATGVVPDVYERPAMSQAYNVSCKDGKRIGLHVSSVEKFWHSMCRAVDREDWLGKYPNRMDRVADYENLAIELNSIFKSRTREQWIPILDEAGFPYALEYELQELDADPQIRHLKVFYDVEHPKHGKVRAAHRPIRVDGSNEIDFLPPPDLGEHSEEVLLSAGFQPEEIIRLRADGVI